jgi:flagellar protein FlaG
MSTVDTSLSTAAVSTYSFRQGRPESDSATSVLARQAESAKQPNPVEAITGSTDSPKAEPVSLEQLNAVVAFIAETVGQRSVATAISVDEDLGRVVIQINDKETGDLVRQIPGEAFLEIAKRMEDLKGLLYDDRA